MFKQLMGFLTGIQNANRKQNTDIKAYQQEQKFKRDGGVSPVPDMPNPVPALPIGNVFRKVMGSLLSPKQAGAQGTPASVPSKQPVVTPKPSMTPAPTPTPGWVPYKKAYDEFYSRRGNPPVSKLTELMAKLTYDNPPLRRNPGLVPGVPILESSGGKNVTYENNPVNWAIQVQKKGDFQPTSWEEAISKMATGVATRQKDYTPAKLLEDWRQSGNLESFGEWYAPTSDNPEHGGKTYGKRLKSFDDEINALLRQFGVQ